MHWKSDRSQQSKCLELYIHNAEVYCGSWGFSEIQTDFIDVENTFQLYQLDNPARKIDIHLYVHVPYCIKIVGSSEYLILNQK